MAFQKSKSSAVATLALISFLLVVGPFIPSAYGAGAVTKTSMTTVSTGHVTVQLTFPSSADPGQAITVSTVATAKSNGRLLRFSIDISSYAGGQLVRLASRTLVTDTIVRVGDNWQAWLQVIIPTNAQRGPLIGKATEVWQETSYQYYDVSYCYQDRNYYYPQNYYLQNWQSQNCYPQNRAYYNTYYNMYDTYGMQYSQPRNRIITLRTTPESYAQACAYHQPYQPSYACQPTDYYGRNYAPSYATQVSSQQTFPLTYVLGCYYP